MKNFIKQIKKYYSELMIIGGVGIFTYNLFNFSYKGNVGGTAGRLRAGSEVIEGIAYYYNSDALSSIAIGAMLIVGGILIIQNQK